MWKILSNHRTRNWLIEATITHSHAIIEKKDCSLEGKRRTENIIYKRIASTSGDTDKTYLGNADGDLKKRFYNHISSLKIGHKLTKTPWQNMFGNLSRNTI